jgi:hypothetical protein
VNKKDHNEVKAKSKKQQSVVEAKNKEKIAKEERTFSSDDSSDMSSLSHESEYE